MGATQNNPYHHLWEHQWGAARDDKSLSQISTTNKMASKVPINFYSNVKFSDVLSLPMCMWPLFATSSKRFDQKTVINPKVLIKLYSFDIS